jgi:hypothetical protein
VQSFLTPLYLQEVEEFPIQLTELRALIEVVNAEMVRRNADRERSNSVRCAKHFPEFCRKSRPPLGLRRTFTQ